MPSFQSIHKATLVGFLFIASLLMEAFSRLSENISWRRCQRSQFDVNCASCPENGGCCQCCHCCTEACKHTTEGENEAEEGDLEVQMKTIDQQPVSASTIPIVTAIPLVSSPLVDAHITPSAPTL